MVSANFYSNIAKFPLLAIPFFILTGFLMDRVGLSRRLVNLLALLVGPVPGGLGIVAILSCVFFGAVSGTGPADTAAIGAVMIPAMVKRGYDKGSLRHWLHPQQRPTFLSSESCLCSLRGHH